MTDFVRGSSSFTRLEVHVCYKTRYCKKVFDFVEIKQRCEEIFREVAAELRIDIKEIGFNRDHVHMDLVHPPTINVCEISKRFKGRSGRKIKRAVVWRLGWKRSGNNKKLCEEPVHWKEGDASEYVFQNEYHWSIAKR